MKQSTQILSLLALMALPLEAISQTKYAHFQIRSRPNVPAFKVEIVYYGEKDAVRGVDTILPPGGRFRTSNQRTMLVVRPMHSQHMFGLGNWWVNNQPMKNKACVRAIAFKKIYENAKFEVEPVGPVTDWRGTTLRVKKALVVLSMSGNWAKAMKHWSKTGDRKLAGELAQAIIDGRFKKGHWGSFELETGWAVIVPSDADEIHPDLRDISRNQLAAFFRPALELMREHVIHPDGNTIERFLNKIKKTK